MRNSIRGFTLIELVIVIVLVSLLAATVVINLDASKHHSVVVQADQFRRNLSHLQLLAISQGARLKLTVTSGIYSVCAAATASCTAGSAVVDPATGAVFSITLSDGVQFTAGTGSYYFDSLGRPVTAATGLALLTGTSNFQLNGVGRATAVNVNVRPVTGFAQATY